MKRILKVIFAVGLVVVLATGANAAPILSLSGANMTAGTIPGAVNDNNFQSLFNGATNQIGGGYFAAQVSLAGGSSNLQIDYFGAEAGFNNAFAFNHDLNRWA